MAKKKVLKTLREISEAMPLKGNLIFTDSKITGEELLLCGQKEIEGKPIEPEKDYVLQVPTYVYFNNYKELKKTLKSKGAQGVIERYKAA